MVVAAAKGGLWRTKLEELIPRVSEIPFDSDRKRMATIHKLKRRDVLNLQPGLDHPPVVAFVKGAPDVVLDLCENIIEDGRIVPLDEERNRLHWRSTATWPGMPSGCWALRSGP